MEILRSAYQEVITLEEWLYRVQDTANESIHIDIVSSGESDRSLLSTIFVGLSCDLKTACFTWSQHSSLREVLLRAVERILKKRPAVQNILTLGYCLRSTDAGAQTAGGDVEITYPNSSFNSLQTKPWETLLTKVGDSILLWLLENTSLFLQIRPTCYVQLTGTPINTLLTEQPKSIGENRVNKSKKLLHRKKTRPNLSRQNVNVATRKQMQISPNKSTIHSPAMKQKEEVFEGRKKRYENVDSACYLALKKQAEQFAQSHSFSSQNDKETHVINNAVKSDSHGKFEKDSSSIEHDKNPQESPMESDSILKCKTDADDFESNRITSNHYTDSQENPMEESDPVSKCFKDARDCESHGLTSKQFTKSQESPMESDPLSKCLKGANDIFESHEFSSKHDTGSQESPMENDPLSKYLKGTSDFESNDFTSKHDTESQVPQEIRNQVNLTRNNSMTVLARSESEHHEIIERAMEAGIKTVVYVTEEDRKIAFVSNTKRKYEHGDTSNLDEMLDPSDTEQPPSKRSRMFLSQTDQQRLNESTNDTPLFVGNSKEKDGSKHLSLLGEHNKILSAHAMHLEPSCSQTLKCVAATVEDKTEISIEDTCEENRSDTVRKDIVNNREFAREERFRENCEAEMDNHKHKTVNEDERRRPGNMSKKGINEDSLAIAHNVDVEKKLFTATKEKQELVQETASQDKQELFKEKATKDKQELVKETATKDKQELVKETATQEKQELFKETAIKDKQELVKKTATQDKQELVKETEIYAEGDNVSLRNRDETCRSTEGINDNIETNIIMIESTEIKTKQELRDQAESCNNPVSDTFKEICRDKKGKTKHELGNKAESYNDTADDVLKETCRDKKKVKPRRKKRNKQCRRSFKPFDAQLTLPRHRYLYRKNAREKLSTFDLLSNLQLNAESLSSLYNSIFVETKVLARVEIIHVESPSQTECVTSLEKIAPPRSENCMEKNKSYEQYEKEAEDIGDVDQKFSQFEHSSFERHSYLLNYRHSTLSSSLVSTPSPFKVTLKDSSNRSIPTDTHLDIIGSNNQAPVSKKRKREHHEDKETCNSKPQLTGFCSESKPKLTSISDKDIGKTIVTFCASTSYAGMTNEELLKQRHAALLRRKSCPLEQGHTELMSISGTIAQRKTELLRRKSKVEGKKVLSAYEIHRHLESSCDQPIECDSKDSEYLMNEKCRRVTNKANKATIQEEKTVEALEIDNQSKYTGNSSSDEKLVGSRTVEDTDGMQVNVDSKESGNDSSQDSLDDISNVEQTVPMQSVFDTKESDEDARNERLDERITVADTDPMQVDVVVQTQDKDSSQESLDDRSTVEETDPMQIDGITKDTDNNSSLERLVERSIFDAADPIQTDDNFKDTEVYPIEEMIDEKDTVVDTDPMQSDVDTKESEKDLCQEKLDKRITVEDTDPMQTNVDAKESGNDTSQESLDDRSTVEETDPMQIDDDTKDTYNNSSLGIPIERSSVNDSDPMQIGVDIEEINDIPIVDKLTDIGPDNVADPIQSADHSYSNGILSSIDYSEESSAADIRISAIIDVLPLLTEFIQKQRKCPYRALLQTFCPVKRNTKLHLGHRKSGTKRASVVCLPRLLNSHSGTRQVYLFLRCCIVKTIPKSLLGEVGNRNRLFKNLKKILSAGRYDKYSLGQLMYGLKTKSIPWLSGSPNNSIKLHLLAKVVYWLMTRYIFVLLRTFFYVTDTGFLRYKLLYYRQAVWSQIHSQGILDLIRRNILKPISQEEADRLVQNEESLGVSVLRFLPKEKSLRPIINMGYTDRSSTDKIISINQQLMVLHSVLSYLKGRHPSLLGYGKLGTDDLYHAWAKFVDKWRHQGGCKLYFLKTDISRCYDTMDQDKMYNIIEKILQEEASDDELIIRKYTITRQDRTGYKTRFVRHVDSLADFDEDFITFTRNLAAQKRMENAIFMDKVVYQHETTDTLLDRLRKHLFHNILKCGGHYYHQQSGISQGSIISTLLCSFYYAEMENKYIGVHENDFLMRIVDDYLYVTPSEEQARLFLSRMLEGFPEYCCYTNTEKVLTNFPQSLVSNLASDWFPWCGMLFNTRTCEVAVDYSRLAGIKTEDTMTFDLASHPGVALQKKLLLSASQKCHPVYLDGRINSRHQITRNVYLLCLLTSYKLHAYIRKLPYHQRAQTNVKFFLGLNMPTSGIYHIIREDKLIFLGVIQSVAALVYWCYGKAQKSSTETSTDKSDLIDKSCVYWICLKAFKKRLSLLSSQYAIMLKALKKKLKILEKEIDKAALGDLEGIVESDLTEDFEMML